QLQGDESLILFFEIRRSEVTLENLQSIFRVLHLAKVEQARFLPCLVVQREARHYDLGSELHRPRNMLFDFQGERPLGWYYLDVAARRHVSHHDKFTCS